MVACARVCLGGGGGEGEGTFSEKFSNINPFFLNLSIKNNRINMLRYMQLNFYLMCINIISG